jgi:hypothetical protein
MAHNSRYSKSSDGLIYGFKLSICPRVTRSEERQNVELTLVQEPSDRSPLVVVGRSSRPIRSNEFRTPLTAVLMIITDIVEME